MRAAPNISRKGRGKSGAAILSFPVSVINQQLQESNVTCSNGLPWNYETKERFRSFINSDFEGNKERLKRGLPETPRACNTAKGEGPRKGGGAEGGEGLK